MFLDVNWNWYYIHIVTTFRVYDAYMLQKVTGSVFNVHYVGLDIKYT